MRRKIFGKKLLSSLLAFSLCLTSAVSMDAEHALAAEAAGVPEVVSAGGSTWNGTDPVRVYVKGDETIAVDSADLTVTEGGGKYELKDGFLTLKEGAEPQNGDKVTIGAAAKYYSEDQLLWNDGLETDGSLIPSVAGKYSLTHSGTMAHTGLKSGTTKSENIKDGTWSPAIGSTGRLVFWYYDPCTEAERDKEALAARESFDQVKFGMVINNYPDLLFGVGIPASGDKGANGSTMTLEQRLEYADTYTVRFSGNWNKTNIARSAGWHKMEADVADGGTRLYIDGAPVCLDGAEEQLVIPGVKTISKAAVATNWGDKKEVKEFVQDKHFIDDMYILKSGAGEPKTADISITIMVQTADGAADQAAVDAAKAAVEAMVLEPVRQADVPDEAAALALVEDKVAAKLTEVADNLVKVAAARNVTDGDVTGGDVSGSDVTGADAVNKGVMLPNALNRSVTVGNVTATVNKAEYQEPVAGSLANPEGKDGFYKFTVTLTKNSAAAVTAEAALDILAERYVAKDFELVFGEDNTGALAKGGSGRVFLENMEDYAIESVKYITDNENVTVDIDGTMAIKPGYTPKAGETVTVTAQVTYYDPADVVFVDSFEGDKKFTDGGANVYAHSEAGSLFGRKAATAEGSTTGYPSKNLETVTDVTVTAWYYDANGGADQTKFGFGINGGGTALGLFYDGSIASYVNDLTKTHYGARVKGFTYNNYAWGTTDAARNTGWHKFEWVIDSEKGLTEKIDGKVISTNKLVGSEETDHNLVKVEENDQVKELNELRIMNGWSNNGTNLGEISHRHFIDGVSVVRNSAETKSQTLTSVEIPVKGITYTVSPETFEADSRYPEAQTLYITPFMENDTNIVKILADGTELAENQWSAGLGAAPVNAQNYPEEMKGYQVTLNADVFRGIADGEHTLVMITTAGTEIAVSFTAKANTHAAADYYLSNGGDDNADGHSPETAWKSFEKLQSVTFGPGDHIYLDAESIWSGVQFRPEGSGAPGSPIVLTKYNDGGDSSKRPILNGDGTLADFDAHSYLAFDAWRAFYPSGAIELFNVEQWEVRGVEITNYTKEMQKGATGRNGIAVIFDYFETQGMTEMPASNADKEKAFYRAGKLEHIVIEDCYVHDVVGYHPTNGAQGRGGKMSGGINAYGPYDDLQINNNIVMYCDVEGIRNDVLAWMGDTRTQFPAYMEDVSISNNYIAGVPGDGVVISSADQPVLENNYLTDAGYSYYATSNKNNISSGVSWSAGNLASCKAVADKTGAVAKDMGNRQSPITMGATNFAGLWFIGTKDAVAQYNEAVNNVWVCNDSEAFDADMFCWGTVFQYNYTYRNNGGFCLFMGTMDDGTLVRYNVSVEDAQSAGISESQNGLFHYAGAPEAIYNNLFILGDKVATIFGGGANTAYFYNNIVIAPNGLLQEGAFDGFHINGSSDGTIRNPKLSGEMKNNLFYPAAILDSVVEGSEAVLENNIVLKDEAELQSVFEDLAGFMAAQPVKALLGRSDFTGEKVEELEYGKGAGVAMSAEAGRSVKTPAGGFDLEQFAGIRLAENSPAIGKGIAVEREYGYKPQNDAVLPLTKDFFKNDISGMTTVDIGPFQYSSVHESANFDELRNLYDQYKDLTQGNYSDATWNVFMLKKAAAEVVLNNQDATQEVVDAAKAELEDAYNKLEENPSTGNIYRDLLQMAYDYAKDLSTEGVVEAAKKKFQAALDNAKALLEDPESTDIQMEAAFDELAEGIWGLGLTQGDKTELKFLIAKAEIMRENQDKYVAAQWPLLVEKLDKANAVMIDGNAMTEDVRKASDELLNAILQQRFKARKDILEGILNKAEAVDESLYTEESVKVFRSAFAYAQEIMANDTLSADDQPVIDKAGEDLEAAILKLVKKEDPEKPTDPTQPTDPTDTPSDDNNQPSDEGKTDATNDSTGSADSTTTDSVQNTEVVSPKTGDYANLGLAALIAVFGIACVGVVVVGKRKKED